MSHQSGSGLSLCLGVAALLSGAGCGESAPEPRADQVEWISPDKLQPGPRRHEALSEDVLTRIKRLHATFADVDETPLEKWIDDFQRDLDPEENVRIWEDMAIAYNKYLGGRDLDLETRKEVFKVVLLRSMAPEKDVLARVQLKTLSLDDAKTIMSGYPSAPTPLDVIQSP